jgi:hypothetical protein
VHSSRSTQKIIHVLIVTPSFPYPPQGGAELRYYHLIKRLSQEYKISLVALTESPIAQQLVEEMQKYCDDIIVIGRYFVSMSWWVHYVILTSRHLGDSTMVGWKEKRVDQPTDGGAPDGHSSPDLR